MHKQKFNVGNSVVYDNPQSSKYYGAIGIVTDFRLEAYTSFYLYEVLLDTGVFAHFYEFCLSLIDEWKGWKHAGSYSLQQV